MIAVLVSLVSLAPINRPVMVTVNEKSVADFWIVNADGRDRTVVFRSTLEEGTTLDSVASSVAFVAITVQTSDKAGWRLRAYDPATGRVVARLSGNGQVTMRWPDEHHLLVWCDRDLNGLELERDRPDKFKLTIVKDFAAFSEKTDYSPVESLLARVSKDFRPAWRAESAGTFSVSDVTIVDRDCFVLAHGLSEFPSNAYSLLRKSDLKEAFRFDRGYPADVYHTPRWVMFRTYAPKRAYVYAYDGTKLSEWEAHASG